MRRQRLFNQHMFAGFHRRHRHRPMKMVRRANIDRLHLRIRNQLFKRSINLRAKFLQPRYRLRHL